MIVSFFDGCAHPLPFCLRTCRVQSGDPSLEAQAPCLLGRMEIVHVQGHAPWSGVGWGVAWSKALSLALLPAGRSLSHPPAFLLRLEMDISGLKIGAGMY